MRTDLILFLKSFGEGEGARERREKEERGRDEAGAHGGCEGRDRRGGHRGEEEASREVATGSYDNHQGPTTTTRILPRPAQPPVPTTTEV